MYRTNILYFIITMSSGTDLLEYKQRVQRLYNNWVVIVLNTVELQSIAYTHQRRILGLKVGGAMMGLLMLVGTGNGSCNHWHVRYND